MTSSAELRRRYYAGELRPGGRQVTACPQCAEGTLDHAAPRGRQVQCDRCTYTPPHPLT